MRPFSTKQTTARLSFLVPSLVHIDCPLLSPIRYRYLPTQFGRYRYRAFQSCLQNVVVVGLKLGGFFASKCGSVLVDIFDASLVPIRKVTYLGWTFPVMKQCNIKTHLTVQWIILLELYSWYIHPTLLSFLLGKHQHLGGRNCENGQVIWYRIPV